MKRSWIVYLLALTLTLGLLAGCGSQPAQETVDLDSNLLHSGYSKIWTLVEYYESDETTPVPEWAADNVVVINSDGTGMHIFGEVAKDETDAINQDDFTWVLEGDKFIVQEHSAYSEDVTKEFTVTNLAEDTLTLEQTKDVEGEAVTARSIYKSVVTPNPDADEANMALTHGLAKIWKLGEVQYDGVKFDNAVYRHDDLLIFCTDGTGYFTKGEVLEPGMENNPNDFFKWTFSEDGTKLLLSEFEHGALIHVNSTLKQLDADNLIYEDYRDINGTKTLVTVIRVPLLPAE